jgi:hypothetical protein
VRIDIADGGDDLEVVLGIEQQLEPTPDNGVVVGKHDPDRLCVRC